MILWQIISTVIFYLWLFLMLWFLWRVWLGTRQHIYMMEQTVLNIAIKNADSAQKAASAAQILAQNLAQQGKKNE